MGLEALAQGGHRRALEFEVEGGFDDESIAEDRLAPDFVEEMTAHEFAEMFGIPQPVLVFVPPDLRGIGHGFRVARFIDESVGQHAAEYVEPAALGGGRVSVGGVIAGALGEPGQERGFRDREVLDVLAKIVPGGLPDSPGAVAEIDLVDVEIENFVLGEEFLDPPGQHHLADLAPESALGAEQQALDRLLGDGGRALLDPASQQVGPGGAQDRRVVQAFVFKEGFVLGGDKGQLGGPGDLANRDQPAALFVELGDQPAIPVQHQAGQRRAVILDAPQVGQVAEKLLVEPEARSRGENEQEGRDS